MTVLKWLIIIAAIAISAARCAVFRATVVHLSDSANGAYCSCAAGFPRPKSIC